MATVNGLAAGIWSRRVGTTLTVIGPGANPQHVIVQRPGERKQFGMPSAWLDFDEPFRPRAVRVLRSVVG